MLWTTKKGGNDERLVSLDSSLDKTNAVWRSELRMEFYHANYPTGVQGKVYAVRIIERGETFVLARSLTHKPSRFLLIYPITKEWVARHFQEANPGDADIEEWLEANL